MTQQWTKAELEDWCRGWCRTPHTTLKAFIDAGFCSDQQPSREEMRLLCPASTERAAVVAWLHDYATFLDKHDDGRSGFDKMAQGLREAVEAIELGEHLK